MIKITGMIRDVDDFIGKLVCPIDDNEGTIGENDCPHQTDLANAKCIECTIKTYNLELVFED